MTAVFTLTFSLSDCAKFWHIEQPELLTGAGVLLARHQLWLLDMMYLLDLSWNIVVCWVFVSLLLYPFQYVHFVVTFNPIITSYTKFLSLWFSLVWGPLFSLCFVELSWQEVWIIPSVYSWVLNLLQTVLQIICLTFRWRGNACSYQGLIALFGDSEFKNFGSWTQIPPSMLSESCSFQSKALTLVQFVCFG